MNMLRVIFIFFFVLISTHAGAQKILLGAETGYQWYGMKSAKAMTIDLNKNIPFNTRIMSNYPSYWSYGGFVGFRFHKGYESGARYNFASTGARISRVDYSGEYELNSVVHRNAAGIYFAIPVYRPGRFMTRLLLDFGYMLTYLEMSESLKLGDVSTINESVSFTSGSMYITPSIVNSYHFTPLTLALRTGYETNVLTTPFSKTPATPLNPFYKDVKPSWSGVAIHVSLSWQLPLD